MGQPEPLALSTFPQSRRPCPSPHTQVFEALSGAEQLELMRRLGPYLVWATLARPEGLHFRRGGVIAAGVFEG